MEAIERLAEAFLAEVPPYVWDGRSLPVPVEEIADSFAGLLVRDVENLATAPGAPRLADGQTLSGLLLPDAGEIWVSASESRQWPGRRRFTIAHELGHWTLHRRHGAGVFCRAAVVDPAADAQPDAAGPRAADPGIPPKRRRRRGAEVRPPLPAPEEEANWFAASILMPARLVAEQYRSLQGDFFSLCERFGASGAAMGRRLHQVVPRGRG